MDSQGGFGDRFDPADARRIVRGGGRGAARSR